MPSAKPFATATGMLRARLSSGLRTRGVHGPNPFTTPGHQERPNGYLFNRVPPPPGQSRKWEDWELPCYVTSFLTIVILGVGLNAKPDLTLETWAHQEALKRLELESSSQAPRLLGTGFMPVASLLKWWAILLLVKEHNFGSILRTNTLVNNDCDKLRKAFVA
ncbi:hypothetical protein HAX54_029511 [Datura stramonium]|uniref:NADH dehydrogenase [ubiquinone] 1 beta subcomplex subunit 11, mitochondrial n=1 Tax=Datura stramonium TaxID=4076 RepID=A0ABS8V632_DATST|nr:hypothetical protein [Datura stramonium]